MTSLLAAPVAAPDDDRPARRVDWFAAAQTLSLVVAVVVLDRVVLPAAGGRDPGVMRWGLLAAAPAFVLSRPWKLTSRVLTPALALPVASFLVCWLAPTGWGGLDRPVAVTYAVVSALTVAAFASTANRRLAVAIAVSLLALDEFAQGWLAWWGGEDPTKPMIGTFYWHNQFGAFLVPGVVLGLALTTHGPRAWRKVGYVVAPVSAAGVLYSTSRASMMMAGVGGVLVLAAAMRMQDRWSRARRWLVTSVLSGATSAFLVTPLFFPHWSSPFAAAAVRNAQESLGGNTGARLDFWVAGWHAFLQRPLTGSGFGSYGGVSRWFLPSGGLSIYPHNDLVRAFVEGGLLAGLPELIVLLLLVVLATRTVLRASRGAEQAVAVGAAVAVLVAMAHALMDFDWSYPALMAQFALMVGLLLAVAGVAHGNASQAPDAAPEGPVPASRSDQRLAVTASLVALLCVVLAVSVVATSAVDRAGRAIVQASATMVKGQVKPAFDLLMATARSPLADPTVASEALGVGAANRLLSPASVEVLLAQTSRLAQVNPDVRVARDQALLQLGQSERALADARALARRDPVHGEPYVRSYAILLTEGGQSQQGTRVLVREAVLLASQPAGAWRASALDALKYLPGATAGTPAGTCGRELAAELQGLAGSSDLLQLPTSCQPFRTGAVVP